MNPCLLVVTAGLARTEARFALVYTGLARSVVSIVAAASDTTGHGGPTPAHAGPACCITAAGGGLGRGRSAEYHKNANKQNKSKLRNDLHVILLDGSERHPLAPVDTALMSRCGSACYSSDCTCCWPRSSSFPTQACFTLPLPSTSSRVGVPLTPIESICEETTSTDGAIDC